MDVFSLLIILGALLIILYPAVKYVRDLPRDHEPSEYEFGPLALAKKAEVEGRKEVLKEKEELEQNWRFGPRIYAFLSAFPDPNVRGHAFEQVFLPNPVDQNALEAEGALQYTFDTEDGARAMILFDTRFAPKWLKKIDENAFFRVVQVLEPSGSPWFHSRVKFLWEDGEERMTGALLQDMERGSWSKAVRKILTDFEKEGPEPFHKKPEEEEPSVADENTAALQQADSNADERDAEGATEEKAQ